MRHSLTAALVLCCGTVAQAQQQPATTESFRLRNLALDVAIDYAGGQVKGTATMELENWTSRSAGRVAFLLHRLMEASSVTDTMGRPLGFSQHVIRLSDDPIRQVTNIVVPLGRPIPPGGRTTVRINYAGFLTPYTEIGWLYVKDHVDTTFTILRVDALAFPEIGGGSEAANRRLPEPDFTYVASVRAPASQVVATAGTATRTPHADGTVTWRYVSSGPAPFLNIAIAPFDTIAEGGVRVFYFRADRSGAKRIVARSRAALDTLARWFGPLHGAPHVTVTEIPDGWGSQASIVGGIIQTAAAFRDPERVTELYHELSHLWNPPDLDTPAPRWNEGLATFLADLLHEKLDGWPGRATSDSARIAALRRLVAADSTYRVVPFLEYGAHEFAGRAPYAVGDLLFATLYDLIGEAEFIKTLRAYDERFAAGGTTRDFVATARAASSHDLARFFDDWIFTTRWTIAVNQAASVRMLADRYR